MSEPAGSVRRKGWCLAARADTMLLGIAIVAGSVVLGGQLGAVAARPTEFAECAKFSADWFQRRQGFAQPVAREDLIAALERARARGEGEVASRLAGMLAKRDAIVVSLCTASR